jgi:hypothetical protein
MATTSINESPTTPSNDVYEIVPSATTSGFNVTRNGLFLRTSFGGARVFATRAGARKRISREKRGDLHR